jgi:hypothetical protein
MHTSISGYVRACVCDGLTDANVIWANALIIFPECACRYGHIRSLVTKFSAA